MMCKTELSRRSPVRESRWRFTSPEEASSGATPQQEANAAADPESESADARGASEDLGGEQITDAVQVGESGSGLGAGGGDLLGHRRDPAVRSADLGDQRHCQTA